MKTIHPRRITMNDIKFDEFKERISEMIDNKLEDAALERFDREENTNVNASD